MILSEPMLAYFRLDYMENASEIKNKVQVQVKDGSNSSAFALDRYHLLLS